MKLSTILALGSAVFLFGCTQEMPVPPDAAFDYRNEGGGRVVFTNTSSNATGYTWHFEDNVTLTSSPAEKEVEYTFQRSGEYNVRLIAKGDGGSRGIAKKINIDLSRVPNPPKAVIDYTPAGALSAPVEVTFSARNSTGSISGYEWLLNNAPIGASREVKHNFTSSGNYTVTLRVTGIDGQSSDTRTIEIGSGATLTAGFEVAAKTGTAPFNVSFTNTSNGATYHWNFGDGTTSQSASPQHEYRLPGVYNVILTAIGGNGARATKVDEIVVYPRCVVTESYSGNTIAHARSKATYNSHDLPARIENQFYYDNGSRREELAVSEWTYNGSALSSYTFNLSKPGQTFRDGRTNFTYNSLGLLVREERRYTGQNYNAGDKGNYLYEYDASTNIITKIQADSTTYTYNSSGVLTQISHTTNSTASRERVDGVVYTISGYDISSAGRVTRVNYQGGAYKTLTYDGKGQRTAMEFTDPARGNKRIHEQWRYDDKINPDFLMSRFKGHPYYAEQGYGTTQNNIIWYKRETAGTTSTYPEERTYNPSYREHNLPSSLVKAGDANGDKTEYQYRCR